jgi:hypothetical protein
VFHFIAAASEHLLEVNCWPVSDSYLTFWHQNLAFKF